MSLVRTVIYIAFLVVFSFTKGFSQVPITINIGSASGEQGETVCVDFLVEDFNKVTSTQFVIRFDPNVVAVDSPIVLTNSGLNNMGNTLFQSNFNLKNKADGFVNFLWFDTQTTGVTLADNDTLFTLCFELIGEPCESTDLCIVESAALTFEFLQIDCITGEENDFEPIINKGEIVIDPSGYMISSAFCSTDDGSNSGSITFSGTGGVGPYSWSVSPGGFMGTGLDDCESVTIDNLGPGTYTVTLIDANNTVINEVITITTNSDFPFVVELEGSDPTCFDNPNGYVLVSNIEGGESPFVYEWSTFQFFSDSLPEQGAGDYQLTITDVNGCTTSSEVTLEVDTLSLSYTVISDPSCEDGATDGIVSIVAEGGTPYGGNNYMFEIDGIIVGNDTTFYFGDSGIPTNPFTPANLPEGCFEVKAFDSLNCYSDIITFCIESGSFSDLEFEITNISCFGECDGAAVLTASDMGNFTFTVTDPNGMTVTEMNTLVYDEDNLCGGEYMVTIEDLDANCTLDTMFTIIEPDLLELNVIDSQEPGCGGGDGMISMEGQGGTEDYTFLWNDAFDQSSRVNMEGGDYSVTITDANGCQDSISFTFPDGGTIGLNAFVCQAMSCGGAMDGSVCATVSAAGAFTFTWEDSNGMSLGTGAQIDGLNGGTYFVTATDGMCTDTDTVFLVPGPTPSVSVMQTDPTCLDSDDGTLIASLVEGTSPAEFEWSEPPSTAILDNTSILTDGVGTYNLHVTDANGCELDTLITMTPPANLIQVDITNITANTCFGECGASATFTASGGPSGNGNYVFFISGVQGSIDPGGDVANVDVLCGGDGWVYAVDGICASDTFFFNVPDAEPIVLNEMASTLEPPSCAGGDDGNITVVVEGGDDSSYDIFWVNEAIAGPTLTNLTEGSYIYNVTDGSNCVFTDTVILVTPDTLTVSVNPLTTSEINCFSDSMGQIGLLTNGGNSGMLTYNWNPDVSNTDLAQNLGPGLYSVTVTDSKGCTAETSYELTSADPIVAVINVPEEPECFGGVTCVGIDTAYGGVGDNFSFSINNGPLFSLDTCINLFAGTYFMNVFDSAGCAFDTMVTINQPEEIIVDLGPDVTINLGDSSDPISAFIVSELDIDSILWNPIENLECNTVDCQVVTFSPLATTDYTITVIDENGCLASDDITVFVDLARNVFFSNIFSPNGDNQNDFFQLATGSGVLEVSYFRLYDRWGNKVHEEEAYMPDDSLHPGWDGTVNNREAEAGVYVYFAEVLFQDNVRVLYKGDVTLVR